MRKEPSEQDLVSSPAIVLMEADITSEVAFVGLWILERASFAKWIFGRRFGCVSKEVTLIVDQQSLSSFFKASSRPLNTLERPFLEPP
jgi:hypothetical protein